MQKLQSCCKTYCKHNLEKLLYFNKEAKTSHKTFNFKPQTIVSYPLLLYNLLQQLLFVYCMFVCMYVCVLLSELIFISNPKFMQCFAKVKTVKTATNIRFKQHTLNIIFFLVCTITVKLLLSSKYLEIYNNNFIQFLQEMYKT